MGTGRKPGRPPQPRTTPEPPPVEGARWVALSRGLFALVDEADLPRVAAYVWAYFKDRHRGLTYYAVARVGGRFTFLHNFVCGTPPRSIDHVNGHGWDCRRSNMRRSTTGQNCANRAKSLRPSSSRFKGVTWDKSRSKWQAQVKMNGKHKVLGRFDDEAAAARAYDAAALTRFGAFARLNFPVVADLAQS